MVHQMASGMEHMVSEHIHEGVSLADKKKTVHI